MNQKTKDITTGVLAIIGYFIPVFIVACILGWGIKGSLDNAKKQRLIKDFTTEVAYSRCQSVYNKLHDRDQTVEWKFIDSSKYINNYNCYIKNRGFWSEWSDFEIDEVLFNRN